MENSKIRELTDLILYFTPLMRKNRAHIRPPGPPGANGAKMNLSMFSLLLLEQNGKLSMGQLAGELGVSSQQLTAIIAPMADKGLVERSTDPANRRLVYVSITETGTERIEKIRRHEEEKIARNFSGLSEEELDSLIYHLHMILNILGEAHDRQPDCPRKQE